MAKQSSTQFLGTVDLGSNKITSLAAPTGATDAATKSYVDTGDGSKQNTLVSGANIKTINGNSVLGSGDLVITGSGTGDVTGGTSSTNNAIAVFNGTTGKAIQSTPITVDPTSGLMTFPDGDHIAFGTGTGTQIGTAATQKFAFWGGTPITRPSATTEIGTVLSNLNLRTAGGGYPITTSGSVALTGGFRLGVGSITATTTLTTTSAARQEITASSAAIDITPPATTTAGQVIKFLRLDSTSQTVRLLGTFNGATNFTITGQYKAVEITTTGTSGVFRVWHSN